MTNTNTPSNNTHPMDDHDDDPFGLGPAALVDGDGYAWYHLGNAAVDSGILMLVDPCYLADFVSDDAASDPVNLDDQPFSYAGAAAGVCWDYFAQVGGISSLVVRRADGLCRVLGRFDDIGTLVECRFELTQT